MSSQHDYFDPAKWLHHDQLGPNAELRRLRLAERAEPAPFHEDRFWRWHDVGSPALALPEPQPRRTARLGNIPIGKIVGVGAGHARTTHDAPTWGEILFTGVHGGALDLAGIAFLVSPRTVKYTGRDRLTAQGFPQPDGLSVIDASAVSRGGMEFEKRGEIYFCENGQQRVVFARFALWHLHRSLEAELTNVWITGAE